MQVCSPNRVADADYLEQIQRLVTSLVKGFRRLPYEERLRRLGLYSLHRYRLCGDLIAIHEMFSGGLDLDPSLFSISPLRPGLIGHPFKVLQGPIRRFRRKLSFSIRVAKYWNRLPTPIVTTPSVNSFKRQLDSAWEEMFAEVPRFPVLLFPHPPPTLPSPNSAIPLNIIPIYATQPLIYCHS